MYEIRDYSSTFSMKRPFCLTLTAADNLDLGLFRYSLAPEEKFTACNLKLALMLGYNSKQELWQNKLDDLFFKPKDKNIFLEILQRNGKIKSFEAALVKKDGKTLWTAITAACIFSKNNTRCLEGIIQNISRQKETQDKLLMEKDFLQCFFDNIPDAVYLKNRNNRIIKVNKFYMQGTGLNEREVIGRTDFDFFPKVQAEQMFKDDNHVLNTGKSIVSKIEKTLLRNGNWNQVTTTKIPLYDRRDKIIGTIGATRDMTSYANLEKQRLNMVISALEILGKALELRDPYTFSHTRHVANIAGKIAKALGWDEDRLLAIKLAGELHDLGKISIPLDILNKPGKLSKLEYCLIQEHAKNCYNLIKDIDFPFPLAKIVYQHHERLDGTGYPQKLKGNAILTEARILAVSDVLETMTHHRPYREALGIEEACKELEKGKGLKYDTTIVDLLLNLIKNNQEKQFWLDD